MSTLVMQLTILNLYAIIKYVDDILDKYMKNAKLTNILQNFGLTSKEADVYLASISLGPTTILKIARTAQIKRTTAYSVIESLKQKGLINIEIRGFKQFFVAENPEKLESIFESRKQQFKDSLPELLALYNLKGQESLIKYYEGLESIKGIYEQLLKEIKPHENYLVTGAQDQWYNLDPDFFQKFIQKRAKLPINIRMLFTDSKIAREHKKDSQNYNEKIKILPADTSLTTNLVITPQKVVIHQLIPPVMAIVIENPSIVKMHQELFEIIWKSI